ncbi:MAG: hypothetical protein HC802_18840, partial [Caldilineaceae bacterium]|nr:hypothetical protein [Caldilineaceae bacterium]
SGLYAGNYVVKVNEASTIVTPFGLNTTVGAAMDLIASYDDATGVVTTTNPTNPVSVTLPLDTSSVLTVDFGYNWSGSIGDYAWYDNNGNTIQEGDPPDEGARPTPPSCSTTMWMATASSM